MQQPNAEPKKTVNKPKSQKGIPKPREKFDTYTENPTKGLLVAQAGANAKRKSVATAQLEKVMSDDGTDTGRRFVYDQEVDTTRFLKAYTAGVVYFLTLTPVARDLFTYILLYWISQDDKNSWGADATLRISYKVIKHFFDTAYAPMQDEDVKFMHKTSFYRARRVLIEKQIIFMKREVDGGQSDDFFVNSIYFFKGDSMEEVRKHRKNTRSDKRGDEQ